MPWNGHKNMKSVNLFTSVLQDISQSRIFSISTHFSISLLSLSHTHALPLTEIAEGNFTAETAPPTTLSPISATSNNNKGNVPFINIGDVGGNGGTGAPTSSGASPPSGEDPGEWTPDGKGGVKIDLSDGNVQLCWYSLCVCVGGGGGGVHVCVCIAV